MQRLLCEFAALAQTNSYCSTSDDDDDDEGMLIDTSPPALGAFGQRCPRGGKPPPPSPPAWRPAAHQGPPVVAVRVSFEPDCRDDDVFSSFRFSPATASDRSASLASNSRQWRRATAGRLSSTIPSPAQRNSCAAWISQRRPHATCSSDSVQSIEQQLVDIDRAMAAISAGSPVAESIR